MDFRFAVGSAGAYPSPFYVFGKHIVFREHKYGGDLLRLAIERRPNARPLTVAENAAHFP